MKLVQLRGRPRWEAFKSICLGGVIATILGAFWYGIVGNPFTNYEITMRGIQVDGAVHDCIQDYAESDSGQGGPFQRCGYTFEVNGKAFGGLDDFPDETVDGDPVRLVYLSEQPEVHLRQGKAASSFLDWLVRKVILGLVLLAMFIGAPLAIVWTGLKNFYYNRPEQS